MTVSGDIFDCSRVGIYSQTAVGKMLQISSSQKAATQFDFIGGGAAWHLLDLPSPEANSAEAPRGQVIDKSQIWLPAVLFCQPRTQALLFAFL